jgi:alanine-synthesizing transaminase
MFSRRTLWESSSNRLTAILDARRSAGARIIDLTLSNPTLVGFRYPEERILKALSGPESMKYRPDPHGMLGAREAISAYYSSRGVDVPVEDLFITASTSESYSLLFRLLCNPEDSVVIPTPSYPLFDYLAGINDAKTGYYRLVRGERWSLDAGSLKKAMTKTVKAVLAIDPHNPTGMFLTPGEMREMAAIASAHGAALIVDEVFAEYRFDGPPRAADGASADPVPASAARPTAGLTFLLNGLSKLSALPQVKLGWIALQGDHKLRVAARSRLCARRSSRG